jgi:hypothetical protein
VPDIFFGPHPHPHAVGNPHDFKSPPPPPDKLAKAQALGADIVAAKNDNALENSLCHNPVGTVNTRHPGVGISRPDVTELLGFPPGLSNDELAQILRIRIHTPGGPHREGLMCGCD